MKRAIRFFIFILPICLLITACDSESNQPPSTVVANLNVDATNTPTNTVVPTSTTAPTVAITSTPTPTAIPIPTSTPTITPTPTATPTPELPVGPENRIPQPLVPISVENANQLVNLAIAGEGTLLSSHPTADGSRIVFVFSNKVIYFEIPSMQRVDALQMLIDNDRLSPYTVSPNGNYFAIVRDTHLQIWDINHSEIIYDDSFNKQSSFDSPTLIFSPDSRTLSLSSNDNLKLIDLATGTILLENDHNNPTFSPDGSLLGTVKFHDVYLWNVNDGSQFHKMSGPFSPRQLTFSPDGELLASQHQNSVVLWQVSDGQQQKTLTGLAEGIMSFSKEGSFIFVGEGYSSHFMRVWHVNDGTLMIRIPGGDLLPDISPDGTRLLATEIIGTQIQLNLWDVETETILVQTAPLFGSFWGFAANYQTVFAGTVDGAQVYNANSGELIKQWTNEFGPLSLVQNDIIVTSGNGQINFYNAFTGNTLNQQGGSYREGYFASDGETLIVHDEFSTLRVIDLPSRQQIAETPLPKEAIWYAFLNNEALLSMWTNSTYEKFPDFYRSLAGFTNNRSPDGSLAYVRPTLDVIAFHQVNEQGQVFYEDSTLQFSITIPNLHRFLFEAKFSPDGQYFAVLNETELTLWRLSDQALITTIAAGSYIIDFAFSPNSELIYATYGRERSDFENLGVWEIASGIQQRSVQYAVTAEEDGTILSCRSAPFAIAPEGNLIVINSATGCNLQVIEAENWQTSHILDVPISSYGQNAFSPDGTLLATAHRGGEIQFWDVANGLLLSTLIAQESSVTGERVIDFAFSEDGLLLGTKSPASDFAGTIKLWGIWP